MRVFSTAAPRIAIVSACALLVGVLAAQAGMPHASSYVNVDRLNVRSGPSLDHEVVGCLEWGSRADMYGNDGEWVRVKWEGSSGGWTQRSMLSDRCPTEEGSGTWQEHLYSYRRDGNAYVVALSPALPHLDSAASVGMRAMTDSIFGVRATDDQWLEAVPGSEMRLYRLSLGARSFWIVPVVADDSQVDRFLVWESFVEAAG